MLDRVCWTPSFETLTMVVVLFCTFADDPASLLQISCCVWRELWLYDWMEDGLAWRVSSEISTGSKKPRKLCTAVLRPDVFVKRPSFSIPACWDIFFMMLPNPSLFHLRAIPRNISSTHFGKPSKLLAHIRHRQFLFWCFLFPGKSASIALLHHLSSGLSI